MSAHPCIGRGEIVARSAGQDFASHCRIIPTLADGTKDPRKNAVTNFKADSESAIHSRLGEQQYPGCSPFYFTCSRSICKSHRQLSTQIGRFGAQLLGQHPA